MLQKLIKHAADRIMASRAPDFVIGPHRNPPYIRRWWVIPRNKFFNIYLHEVQQDDDDRATHSHPWINMSYVVEGGYDEVTPKGIFPLEAGGIRFRMPSSFHRLELGKHSRTVTFFITGPRVKEWGFDTEIGFIPWKDFVDIEEGGNGKEIGKSLTHLHN